MHFDMKERGLAAFLAMEDCSIHVTLNGHGIVQRMLSSIDDMDKDAYKEYMRAWASGTDQLNVRTVHYKKGELVLMHGMLPHAGAAGDLNVWALRGHFYLQIKQLPRDVDDKVQTYPLLMFGDMAHKLGQPRLTAT